MYSYFQLCPTLTPKEKCIRLRQYEEGHYIERFHEHVLAHQLAAKVYSELLKTLVLRYEEATAKQIVGAYLTRRGRDAKLSHPPLLHSEYPEPGVTRLYCGGYVCAWIDAVCDPERFRLSAKNHRQPG